MQNGVVKRDLPEARIADGEEEHKPAAENSHNFACKDKGTNPKCIFSKFPVSEASALISSLKVELFGQSLLQLSSLLCQIRRRYLDSHVCSHTDRKWSRLGCCTRRFQGAKDCGSRRLEMQQAHKSPCTASPPSQSTSQFQTLLWVDEQLLPS